MKLHCPDEIMWYDKKVSEETRKIFFWNDLSVGLCRFAIIDIISCLRKSRIGVDIMLLKYVVSVSIQPDVSVIQDICCLNIHLQETRYCVFHFQLFLGPVAWNLPQMVTLPSLTITATSSNSQSNQGFHDNRKFYATGPENNVGTYWKDTHKSRKLLWYHACYFFMWCCSLRIYSAMFCEMLRIRRQYNHTNLSRIMGLISTA